MNDLNKDFDTLRATLKEEMEKPHNAKSEESKQLAGFLLLGLSLLQSAFGDLRRSADALEQLAQNDSDRRVIEDELRRG